jgi:hypothetical protein
MLSLAKFCGHLNQRTRWKDKKPHQFFVPSLQNRQKTSNVLQGYVLAAHVACVWITNKMGRACRQEGRTHEALSRRAAKMKALSGSMPQPFFTIQRKRSTVLCPALCTGKHFSPQLFGTRRAIQQTAIPIERVHVFCSHWNYVVFLEGMV